MVLLKVSCLHIVHNVPAHASTRACLAAMVTLSVLVAPSPLPFYLPRCFCVVFWARHHQAVGSVCPASRQHSQRYWYAGNEGGFLGLVIWHRLEATSL